MTTVLSSPVDIVILSNGPGELVTWVRPVVQALRSHCGQDRTLLRISVVLSPCSHASGREAEIAQSYPEVDRVQAAVDFWPFLLAGRTRDAWDWRDRGVVLFLGGDQFFTVLISRRLGYRSVIYAEWEARWLGWVDRFGLRQQQMLAQIPLRSRPQVQVVGDLIAEAGVVSRERQQAIATILGLQPDTELIGLLPGSKPAKLGVGVPFCLAIAQRLQTLRQQTRFVIPVAPTLDLEQLVHYADPQQNPLLPLVEGVAAELVTNPQGRPTLRTAAGVSLDLWTETPAYDLLSQCHLCLTTIGANTAELASLAVPMLVLIPTQQLDAMRAWDGLPGLLANLPGMGKALATAINWLVLQRGLGLRAWPNLWAGREIVPELVGRLQPQEVSDRVLNYLTHPQLLEQMRHELQQVRGEPGAAARIAALVQEVLLLNFK